MERKDLYLSDEALQIVSEWRTKINIFNEGQHISNNMKPVDDDFVMVVRPNNTTDEE